MGEVDKALAPSFASAIAAADLAGVGIVVSRVVDGQSLVRYVNRAAERILGRGRDELMGEGTLACVPERERAQLMEQLRRRIAGEPVAASYETKAVHTDGRELAIHCSVGYLPIDGEPSIVVFFHDVTARREAEHARDESQARLHTLVEVAPDGIFVTRDGAIVYGNPAAARILGIARAGDLAGRPLAQFLAPHELEVGRARLDAAESHQLLPIRVYDVRGESGKTLTVEATSLAITWDGSPATLTFAHDITMRLQMEAQLAQANRLAALGALAAGVAHEVNNPLAYVALGFDALERLAAALPEQERAEAHALLRDMRGGVERVAAITRDLRTFAREREEEPQACADLASVLTSVERLVAHALKHNAKLLLDIPAGLPPLHCGALRLEQVLVNLLLNAVQSFDPPHSTPEITVRARVEGAERVTIEVADNGPGMTPEVCAKIFEPFFTTKPTGKGTGLGLAISQTIVMAAGGTLTVESELGRGTTFLITLPVSHVKAPVVATVQPTPRRARILVVDDEPAIARSLGALLSARHDVELSTSGADALARINAGADYDIVLCDLMMPQMTGMDVYDRLAVERPGEHAKLVFMTGGAFTERARSFLASVPNRRLEKPFALATLDAIIDEIVSVRG